MNLSWRDCHDYIGGKEQQKCRKCRKTIIAGQLDDNPKCSKRDGKTLEKAVEMFFSGKLAKPYLLVGVKPFHTIKVTLQDLLEGK